MSKHTQGPWAAIFGHDFITIVAADNKPPVVCRIKNEVTPQELTGEDRANARLIAAAPDLLEALEKVMEWIKNWDPEFSFDPDWVFDAEKACAAIAKATGEQS